MNPEPEATLRTLHRVYCEATGYSPTYLGCERRLLAFHNQGFGEDDIRLVVWFCRRENAKMHGAKWGTGFGQLFLEGENGVFERFSDLLGMARGAQRAAAHKAKHSYPPGKAEVLRATGRPDAPAAPDGCIPLREALKQIRESL